MKKLTTITQLWLTADKQSVVTGGPTKGYRWKAAGVEVSAEEVMQYGLVEGVHYRTLGGPTPRKQAFTEAPTHDLPTTSEQPQEEES